MKTNSTPGTLLWIVNLFRFQFCLNLLVTIFAVTDLTFVTNGKIDDTEEWLVFFAASPIIVDNQVFLTSSYGIGGQLVDLSGEAPRTVWSNDDSLSSQYPTPLYHDGRLYGTHGREDGATAELRCVNFATGEVQWRKAGFGMTHLILADQKLLALRTAGELVLIDPSANGYVELGRIRVSDAITRPLPALSRGMLYLRDASGQLSCWKLP